MTLVACYDFRNWPILIGDTLISISNDGIERKSFNIPTHEDVNKQASRHNRDLVDSLVQKITILNPQLALAWAGYEDNAESVFNEILQLGASATMSEVIKVLEARQGEPGMELYINGITLEERMDEGRPIVRFGWDSTNGFNGHEHNIPGYGVCYAGGSGAEAFLGLLEMQKYGFDDNTPDIEGAIMSALGGLVRLSGDQLRASAGITLGYGGIFEIVTRLNDKLQKIGDIAYHFWQAKSAPNNRVTIKNHATIKVDYFEDYLVVTKLGYGSDTELTETESNIRLRETTVVRPVHRPVSRSEKERLEREISHLNMNARFNAFYVHLPELPAPDNTYISVHKAGRNGQKPLVEFEEFEDGYLQSYDSEIFRRIRSFIDRNKKPPAP